MLPTSSLLPSRSRGLTLIELMVSMTIGLIILLGMVLMFVNNTKSQAELEKSNRQTESGRYAIQLMSDDIYNAGYYGEFDPSDLPNPALPGLCDATLDTLRAALALPVQGLDDSAIGESCLKDIKVNTDVLLVRRVETCLVGKGNCEPEGVGGAFFQASLCNNGKELGNADATKHFSLDTDVALLTRHKRDCTDLIAGTPAEKRRFVTHIYYIANNHKTGDKIPTLMRATLSNSAPLGFTVEPMAEGIESMHFEYGVDTNLNGAPDLYTPAPATATAWRDVVAVKIHMLSRNTEQSPGYTDTNVYTLGLNAGGTPNQPVITGTNYKRHVFSKMVTIPNTAGRKSP